MAKSIYEPKKVPTYAENIIKPGTGLKSAPVPVRQRTANRNTPKLDQAQNPAPAPIVTVTPPAVVNTTPPPPVGETRAFYFDGATELTSSFSATGGSSLYSFTLASTITPAWSEETTGSFVIWSLGNPSDDADYRRTIGIERTSGSNGYTDSVFTTFTSGSYNIRTTKMLLASPNFYSGSVENLFLEVGVSGYSLTVKENGLINSNKYTYSGPAQTDDLLQGLAKTITPAGTYTTSIGGYNSGSSGYFSGSINNLALSKGISLFVGSQMPQNIEGNTHVDLVYKFEGNTLATKGGEDLEVVGTETYISSSL